MSKVEFDPVDHITIGAVGDPGERIFMLQARSGSEVVTVVLEKSHVLMLTRGMHVLLSQVGYPDPLEEPDPSAMTLDETSVPVFRAQTISLGYEETRDLVMIECDEVPESEEEGGSARFWVTRMQLAAIGIHGMKVAAEGRPICPYCWRPMDDPDTHICRALNGHDQEASAGLGGEES